MVVGVCEKCKYVDLIDVGEENTCIKCGGEIIPTGLSSLEWNKLTNEDMMQVITDTICNHQAPTQPQWNDIYSEDTSSEIKESTTHYSNKQNDNICEYFTLKKGIQKGPFSATEIINKIQSKQLLKHDSIWCSRFEDWKTLEETEFYIYFPSYAPPTPIGEVNNIWLWLLAIAPLLSEIICKIIGFDNTLIISLILNILFFSLDVNTLKKSGRNVEKWIWTGLVIVPVYLFIRAQKTNRKYGAFVIWFVCFILSISIGNTIGNNSPAYNQSSTSLNSVDDGIPDNSKNAFDESIWKDTEEFLVFEPQDISGGIYYIGTDIPAGAYTLKVTSGTGNFFLYKSKESYEKDTPGMGWILGDEESWAESNMYTKILTNLRVTDGQVIKVLGSLNMNLIPISNYMNTYKEDLCGGIYVIGCDLEEGAYEIIVEHGSGNVFLYDSWEKYIQEYPDGSWILGDKEECESSNMFTNSLSNLHMVNGQVLTIEGEIEAKYTKK